MLKIKIAKTQADVLCAKLRNEFRRFVLAARDAVQVSIYFGFFFFADREASIELQGNSVRWYYAQPPTTT